MSSRRVVCGKCIRVSYILGLKDSNDKAIIFKSPVYGRRTLCNEFIPGGVVRTIQILKMIYLT